MTVLAVLAASGSGSRLGADVPKAIVELEGVPLVVRTARLMAASGIFNTIVVTTPQEDPESVEGLFPDGRVGHENGGEGVPVVLVPGGATRQASVARGLAAGLAAAPDTEVVLIHDAARCLTPPDLFVRIVETVRQGHKAVTTALPSVATIKQVGEPNEFGAEPVTGSSNRRFLRAAQTPQAFTRELIVRAHQEAAERAGCESTAATDDCGLVEALGERVWVVPGDERAMKITTQRDLVVAKALMHELGWGVYER